VFTARYGLNIFYIIQVNIYLQSSLCHGSGHVIGLSPNRTVFNSRSVHVTFLLYEVALRQVFSPRTLSLPCQCHSTIIAYSSFVTGCSYRKDKWSKPGSL